MLASRLWAMTLLLLVTLLTGCGCDQTLSLTLYAWIDSDGNGLQNVDEQPLPGVTFTVFDQNGVVKERLTQVTGASGKVSFFTMYGCSGTADWIIEAQPPRGYRGTTPMRIRISEPRLFAFVPEDTK